MKKNGRKARRAAPRRDDGTTELLRSLEKIATGISDLETTTSNCLAQLKIANRKLEEIADKPR